MPYHDTISDIAARGVETIMHCGLDLNEPYDLRHALLVVVRSPAYREATAQAESVFARLTQTRHEDDALARFLNGWQTVHVTALYVSGLMVRIQEEAQAAAAAGEGSKAALLFQAAFHTGRIIVEDTGLKGIQHGALYERFANGIMRGSDEWKLNRHASQECKDFRRYVEKARLRDPVETGLLTTAASENWNTGEYTLVAPMIVNWLEKANGFSSPDSRKLAAYAIVHAGDTELDHFTHALKAWQLYCTAHGREAGPAQAADVFARYAEKAAPAYRALKEKLQAAQPAATVSLARRFAAG